MGVDGEEETLEAGGTGQSSLEVRPWQRRGGSLFLRAPRIFLPEILDAEVREEFLTCVHSLLEVQGSETASPSLVRCEQALVLGVFI